jgi:hypothetical protein
MHAWRFVSGRVACCRLREACSRYRTARLVSPAPDESGGYVQVGRDLMS